MAPFSRENFFHAIWLDSLPDRRALENYLDREMRVLVESLRRYMGAQNHALLQIEPVAWQAGPIKYVGFARTPGGMSTGLSPELPTSYPLFEFGLAADNFVAVEVDYENNGSVDPALPAIIESYSAERGQFKGTFLNSLKQMITERNPDILIHGNHNCYINCGNCCKKDSRFLVGNGYCLYYTEIGGYCLPVLGGRPDGRIPICSNWWCTLVSRCTDGYLLEDPSLPRPHIRNLASYTREQKLGFMKAREAALQGAPLEKAAEYLQP